MTKTANPENDVRRLPTTDEARRSSDTLDSWLSGCCVYRLANGQQCKRAATELTTWGAFCWQHASPVYAIRHIPQATANQGA